MLEKSLFAKMLPAWLTTYISTWNILLNCCSLWQGCWELGGIRDQYLNLPFSQCFFFAELNTLHNHRDNMLVFLLARLASADSFSQFADMLWLCSVQFTFNACSHWALQFKNKIITVKIENITTISIKPEHANYLKFFAAITVYLPAINVSETLFLDVNKPVKSMFQNLQVLQKLLLVTQLITDVVFLHQFQEIAGFKGQRTGLWPKRTDRCQYGS